MSAQPLRDVPAPSVHRPDFVAPVALRRLDTPPAPTVAPPVVHWIEIELIGDDDQPVPYEAYRLTLPDGTQVEGHLDARGFARHDGLNRAGDCVVTFPRLDREAWRFERVARAREAA